MKLAKTTLAITALIALSSCSMPTFLNPDYKETVTETHIRTIKVTPTSAPTTTVVPAPSYVPPVRPAPATTPSIPLYIMTETGVRLATMEELKAAAKSDEYPVK